MEKKFIPLSVPNLKGNELEYVSQTIKTEWVSAAGSFVNDFEKGISEYVKSEGAVSCQNGTSGLHTALILCGVGRNDIVLVPTFTFIAAVNPVNYVGAEPVFIDCDNSLCIDPQKLRKFCECECEFINDVLIDKHTGKAVKAVVAVHVFGNMADLQTIKEICKKYNLKLIEDATEALGTYYTDGEFDGKFAGTIGDVGVYSFNGNKIITTGGGGILVSQNKNLLAHAKHLTTQAKSDEVYFEHDEIGYNYRLTNMAAAMGLAQLEQLEKFIQTKSNNYELYCSGLEKYGLKLLPFNDNIRSNKWFYSLLTENSQQRDLLISELHKCGIQTRPAWGLIHQQLPYKDSRAYEIEKAIYYRERIVNIPCSTSLTEEEVKYVVSCIVKIIKGEQE